MLTVKKLRRKPQHFHAFTGLTPEQFDLLLEALEPAYRALETERKLRRPRRRAPGAGPHFKHALPERLLLTLLYLKLYLTQTLIGYLFDLDNANVSREIQQRMLPALREVLPGPMRDELGLVLCAAPDASADEPVGTPAGKPASKPGGRPRRISTLEELLERHPEFGEILIDATEQETPRPKDPEAKRVRYSGKKKRHTLKTQLVTTPNRLVLHATRHVPGRVPDVQLLRFSGVLHQVPAGTVVRVDRGYEGIDGAYPHVQIERPDRGGRGRRVTLLGKIYNHYQNSLRAAVEHTIGQLKHFRILAGCYRGQVARYDVSFEVCAGLNNFQRLGVLAW